MNAILFELKQTLQHWWSERQPRDQKILTLAACCLGTLLLFGVIIKPLADKQKQLLEQVETDSGLLHYLQSSEGTIVQLQAQVTSRQAAGNTSLLTVVTAALHENNLDAYTPMLNQDASGTVTVTFTAVSFDLLIQFLQAISNHTTCQIKQFTTERIIAKPGEVSATVVLID